MQQDLQHRARRAGRAARVAGIVLLSLLCLAPFPSASASPGFIVLADGEVIRVTLPDRARIGLVLLLPDALGGDTRSLPYVEQLNAEGIAVAEPQWQRIGAAEQARRAQALLPLLAGIARSLDVPPAIGVAGFGFGGRVAVRASAVHGWPAAALYPGCDSLAAEMAPPQPPVATMEPSQPPVATTGVPQAAGRARVLVLHGSADTAEPQGSCARLIDRLGPVAERHEYFGATYAWDYEAGPWENMAALLPAPEGEGPRRRAHRSSGVTTDSAYRVADFLARQLLPARREAAR